MKRQSFVPEGIPTASNGSVSLAYERHGSATADTVAFVEGLGFGRWMWRWQARALADGYGVLLWDNRDTGAFDVPETYDEREAMSYRMEPALSDGFAEANPELFENILEWRLASDASDRARAWQAAAVEAFDGASHLFFIEHASDVTDRIQAFLDDR